MKFIEIEGLDGSGKETQSKLLAQHFNELGIPALRITFPDYEHSWSVFVKMYLGGEFGSNVNDVNAYTATSFYALDRYASYKKNWEQIYKSGTVIIADRYVGSNLIHQMSKLPREEWSAFFEWQQDFEFGKLGLPRPDEVLYLKMDPNTSKRLMEKRYQGDETKKDLHERNLSYLLKCRETAQYAVDRSGWKVIRCCDGENPYTIEAIHQKILEALGL